MKIFLEMSSQELLQGISSGALVDLIKEISVVDDTEEKVITMNAAADQIQQEHMEKGEPKVPAKKPAAAETPPAKPKPPEKEQLAEDPKPAEEKKPAPAPAPAKRRESQSKNYRKRPFSCSTVEQVRTGSARC